jgi:glutamate dehydrogenase/leucine dehydrogenase
MQENNESIRVALWGFGNMNKMTLKILVEKGYKIVAVIGKYSIGLDAGEVAELQTGKLGIKIVGPKNARGVLK